MIEGRAVEGRRIEVRGTVQGVGFRPWIYRLAVEEGLSGRVRNDARGVTIEAFGRPEALEAFLRRLGKEAPPAALLREVSDEPIPAESLAGFAIVPSERGGGAPRLDPARPRHVPECLREVRDPGDRRHLYPFTNCTHCGPRFTIARDVPYDRPATTMAAFAMCPDVPARVRGPPRPAVPCAADRLPRLRAAGAAPGAVRRRGGRRRRRCDRDGGAGPRRRADRGGEGPRRLPPRVRRDVVRRRAAPPRAQEARREAVRGHGPHARRRARGRAPRSRRGAPAGLGRAARSFSSGSGPAAASPPRWRPAIPWWA